MNQNRDKTQGKQEQDIDLEILVNAVVAAKMASNAAEAALRNFLKRRAGASSGGAPAREVPHTFMAKATRMVHNTDSPEETTDAGQTARDGGGDGLRGEARDGRQDDTRGDDTKGEDTARSDSQQG